MTFNTLQFAAVVETAKAKAANNPRWLAAIEKAAEGILSGAWIVTELVNGLMITTENGTYLANGVCQCKAFEFGQACKHRAAARLIEMYNETGDEPVSSRVTLIAEIEAIWPRVEPHLPLATELMARFGKSNLNMLDDDMLRRVRLAISM